MVFKIILIQAWIYRKNKKHANAALESMENIFEVILEEIMKQNKEKSKDTG